ncbi:MAG TPA: response regulator transcription factor [Actinomycetales bacterium]|nr:response regulator transcription factor [Actinomycetales bacterium]
MPATSFRILVVEDERDISEQIARRLESEGWEVRQVHDGLEAVSEARDFSPDAVVLDVMLPGIDGLEVCRRIQADREIPVLMLTARDDETDILVGLGVGADDYMTKPFSMRELVARLKALLRRVERAERIVGGPVAAPMVLGDIEVDREGRRVRRAGEEVHLTPTEFDLLVCLADNEGKVLSREALLEQVWDWVDASGTRTVDSHIKALRRKLGSDVVRTVHGVGYAFDTPSA